MFIELLRSVFSISRKVCKNILSVLLCEKFEKQLGLKFPYVEGYSRIVKFDSKVAEADKILAFYELLQTAVVKLRKHVRVVPDRKFNPKKGLKFVPNNTESGAIK